MRQKRELKKEKLFRANLIQQCKGGEAFSAEEYIQERLDTLKKINESVVLKPVKQGKLLH